MMSKLCTHSERYGKDNHVGVEVKPDVADSPQGFAFAVAEASKNIDAACTTHTHQLHINYPPQLSITHPLECSLTVEIML